MQKQGTLLEWLALAVIVLLIIGGMGFVALRMVIAPRMATPPAPAPAAVAQAEPTATALADAIATDTPPTPNHRANASADAAPRLRAALRGGIVPV
ncbi:MAG: hypothetical protein HC876_13885 [Chloroflexaceae bacterium]|nr:hypothetical protein [Chloroflexaceae bacterium]